MMFTVVNNPSTAPSGALVAPRPVETGNALALLADRQFHVCGENMRGEASHIQASAGGAFLVGEDASKYVLEIGTPTPASRSSSNPVLCASTGRARPSLSRATGARVRSSSASTRNSTGSAWAATSRSPRPGRSARATPRRSRLHSLRRTHSTGKTCCSPCRCPRAG